MTAEEFTAWAATSGLSDAEIARRLGCARNSVASWRIRGAPTYVALACAALSEGLAPWTERKQESCAES
jgi:transposase-like protein